MSAESGQRFPYREEGNPPVLRPTVDVRLTLAPHGDWSCRALIDTGSPTTVFDRGVADALGVRIGQAGAETSTVRLMGRHLQVQFGYIGVELIRAPEFSWGARVAFIAQQDFQMPFQGLLGTEGFLDRFAVTFNKYYDYIAVRRADDDL